MSFSSFLCIAAQRKRTDEISSTTECPNSAGLPQTETGKTVNSSYDSMFVFMVRLVLQSPILSQSFCSQRFTAVGPVNSISQYFTSLLHLVLTKCCCVRISGSQVAQCGILHQHISLSAISAANVVLTLFADSHLF